MERKPRRITPNMVGATALAILTRGIPAMATRAYKTLAENAIKRWNKKANTTKPLYPRSPNGGQRRKNAVRARRMNNAGHGTQWSKRHA